MDVTNSDENSIGETGGLFLAGTPDTTPDGCTIHIPKYTLPNGRSYRAKDMDYNYGEYTCALFDESIRILADTDFPPAPSSPAGLEPETEPDTPKPETPTATQESFPAPDLTDLDPNDYYWDAMAWAVAQGITTFSPDQECTHGQILTFLWRAAGKPYSIEGVPA